MLVPVLLPVLCPKFLLLCRTDIFHCSLFMLLSFFSHCIGFQILNQCSADLDMLFQNFDRTQTGVIELDNWLFELFGKWSTDTNTFGSGGKEAIYEGKP